MFSLLAFTFACDDTEDGGGKSWDPQLSTTDIKFDYESNSTTISAQKDIWGIGVPQINGKDDSTAIIIYGENGLIKQITGTWYSASKIDDLKISVNVKENESDNERQIYLPVWRGNYYGGITISQSSHP